MKTFIILFWLYYEGNSVEKISNHASYTLLYVLPTLPMFLVFPYIINKFSFYWSIFISVLLTSFFIWVSLNHSLYNLSPGKMSKHDIESFFIKFI